MSKPKFDSDGFQIVNSKRFSKNKRTKIPQKDVKYLERNVEIDINKSKRRIDAAVEDLQASKYLEDILNSVSTLIKTRKVLEIVCFGLGHFVECNISRYQLALLLCFKDTFNPIKVLVHDPIFYKTECEILKDLNLEVVEENSEGSYIISEEDKTLVYFPHCPKQLTNNFLWSNWGINLHNCILFCNSFNSLIENQPSRLISETVPYLHKIQPYVSEIKLENNFKYTNIYNDTSIHIFPINKLQELDPNFWLKGAKPEYRDTEEFITSVMIKKLTI